MAEGWCLMTRSDGLRAIQRDDEAKIFETDDDAFEFVIAKADGGSEYHRGALELAEYNFDEDV